MSDLPTITGDSAQVTVSLPLGAGVDPTPVRAVVCLQENSPDRHFVIGAVAPAITMLAGFSGHGFKFAPVIGDIAADLALQGTTSRSIAPFSPQRFANQPHRSRA